MFRHLLVLLLVCTPKLVLCQDEVELESQPLSGVQNDEPVEQNESPLAMIQNEPVSLKTTLDAVKKVMPGLDAPLTAMEALPEATEQKRHSIFRKYFDTKFKLFSSHLGLGDINIGDHRGLLTEFDKIVLRQFHDISLAETQVLIVCPPDFLPRYQKEESTDHVPTWGELMCALRLMLLEMTKDIKAINVPIALEVFKSVHMTYPEYATGVFTSSQVNGDILVLPLLLTQKVYEMLPRKHIGDKTAALPDGATRSAVLDELKANGITVEELLELVIKRIVKYYEKLGEDVFCSIKRKVMRIFGEHSPASMAFKFADAYTCLNMEEPERMPWSRDGRISSVFGSRRWSRRSRGCRYTH